MKLIQEIGSYAGFAAVVGLAILSALYFSQARDVRRLRDWAGRAPERDAEARARVTAAPNVAARPSTPAAAQQQQQAGAATAAGRGGVAAPPKPPGVRASSGSTQILGPSSNGAYADDGPWYRRLPARYIALIVAAVIVVGGGIAFGAIQLLGGDNAGGGGTQTTSSSSGGGGSGGGGKPSRPKAPPIKPADVKVLVFNGTTVSGLGKQYSDKVKGLGFTLAADPSNAPTDGQKAESVVFYAPGQKAKAVLVRKKLKISNIEPLDSVFSPLAGTAQVVVVIGSNATP